MTELTNLLLNPQDARLLVIDAQNDVCDASSDYANSETPEGKKRDIAPIQEVVKNGIIPFLQIARKRGLHIGFIQSIYLPNQYLDVSPKWLTIDQGMDDPEWRIKIYRNMPEPADPIFKKDTQNPFTYQHNENGLADWLIGTSYVLVAGFVSYGCIKEGVEALLKRDYIPVVLEDCVGASKHRIKEHSAILEQYKAQNITGVVNSRNITFSHI